MSARRLKLRLKAREHDELAALAEKLGLRPSQVAYRLLSGELSGVSLENRALWLRSARTVALLEGLSRELHDLPEAPSALVALVSRTLGALETFRASLLGLEPDVHEQPEQPL